MSNPVGKPLKFKTVEALQEAIDAYFNKCDERVKHFYTKDGSVIDDFDPEPYAMAGLAYAIGLSRQALMEYSHRDGYGDAIKRARNRIEADVERRMLDKNTFTPGLIFNAKNNFDWKDKTEQQTDLTTGGDKLTPLLVRFLDEPNDN